jgi:valyl-tRNA synthetase
MRLGLCSRSGDVVEPTLKPQWWVACADMAAAAGAAARDGRLTIHPKESEATWHRWLDGIRDWCVSRQLWWGHRIPAFYVKLDPAGADEPGAPSEHTDRWVVAADAEAALADARARWPEAAATLTVVQDADVLDTWFSSGLFPFSVFGWPDATPDLARFYPTSLLETGHDILFFWVARMVMLGMELTGQVPFADVYLHTMVRDAHGRKMSKSLGNVIDPLHVVDGISLADLHATLEGGNLDAKEVAKAREGQQADFPDGIEECGADALRMALVSYTTQARDINLDMKRVITYRYWCNKLWNAVRFAMLNLGAGFAPDLAAAAAPPPPSSPLACRWILSRLDAAAAAANSGFAAYDFAAVVGAAYAFWQYDVCDVFIELVKPAVAAEAAAPAVAVAFRQTLWTCLDAGLRLLHPLMPFVTEELWQRLPRGGAAPTPDSIMVAPYPTPGGRADEGAEAAMAAVAAAVQATRNLRTGYGLTPRQRPPLTILPASADAAAPFLGEGAAYLAALAPGESATVAEVGAPAPPASGVAVVSPTLSVAVALAGVLDPVKELAKLTAKRDDAAARGAAVRGRRGAAGYEEKTPADVRAADTEKLAAAEAELALLEAHMEEMRKLSLEDK